MNDVRLIHGNALVELPKLDAASVDLIVTDPPYHRVRMDLAWDRQWKDDAAYLDWIGQLCREWARVLMPNGSLYCFASPRMAWGVEGEICKAFTILNRITWRKDEGWARRQCKEEQRAYFPASEAIIFAEQRGSDAFASGEAGYVAKCDEVRGFVFEPLRSYLVAERDRAGLTTRRVAEEFQKKTGSRTVTGMAGHWFERVQWDLPTAANYAWLRDLFHRLGQDGPYLRREYEYLRREYEDLRREYEDLRREYEDLRRPFVVSADVPYTDVWDFPTVPSRPGKHPCQKPLDLISHIISASSRPEAVVLDCFLGSGVAGEAAVTLGREFIGIEKDPRWFEAARTRIAGAVPTTIPIRPGKRTRSRPEARNRTPLFAAFA